MGLRWQQLTCGGVPAFPKIPAPTHSATGPIVQQQALGLIKVSAISRQAVVFKTMTWRDRRHLDAVSFKHPSYLASEGNGRMESAKNAPKWEAREETGGGLGDSGRLCTFRLGAASRRRRSAEGFHSRHVISRITRRSIAEDR